jgi:hypothetical protein
MPSPGGVVVAGPTTSSVGGGAEGSVNAVPRGTRNRGEAAAVGSAVVRPPDSGTRFVSFPFYGPWGQVFPWFGSAFGWNLGYLYYDPWRYGATSWMWGRGGFWYDPWSYAYGGSTYYSPDTGPRVRRTTGALRVKANVASAQVFVDGALAGVVDDFDGLKNHLQLEAGQHTLELRAEGYATASVAIRIAVDRTTTERITLKKQ